MKRNLKKLGLGEEQEFSHIVDALKDKLLALTEAVINMINLSNKWIYLINQSLVQLKRFMRLNSKEEMSE